MDTPTSSKAHDVLVIGAGFGGLAAALELARRGANVALCEALAYPGGCASTFRRRGYAFESGATLFSGLGPTQLFGRWATELELPVVFETLDPVVELRAGTVDLLVHADRARFVDLLASLPGAPRSAIHAFFEQQRGVADVLWSLFEDPSLLPPFSLESLLRHARTTPRYLALLPLLGRPLEDVLKRHGLEHFAPLRTYLDALCQITVQCSAAEAEAPFAFGAMDYYWRGTGHVRGGIGVLATALTDAIARLGGTVLLANAVRSVTRDATGFRVETRRGTLHARAIVANVLPASAASLIQPLDVGATSRLDRLGERVDEGWGAAMIYRVVAESPDLPGAPKHMSLVLDPARPMTEGNHVFLSSSGPDDGERAPAGFRGFTASTHVPLAKLRRMRDEEAGTYVAEVQARMRATIERRAPEWCRGVRHEETASPRTFERFTRRPRGAVGGVPRRAGLHHYSQLGPLMVAPDVYLVGDSVFPGQSTLATALGGVRTAASLLRNM